MKLAELIIENFRGIKGPIHVKIDNIVVLIGKNNAGKSTILDAYEAFASTGKQLGIHDFYDEQPNNTPKITGIFVDVNKEEMASKWIHNDTSLGYTNCIKAQYRWEAPNTRGQKYAYNPQTQSFEKGGLGGLDTILTSRIPTPIKISPFDEPEELEKKILEILSSAIRDNVKQDKSKVSELLEQIESLAKSVQEEMKEELDKSCDMIATEIEKVFPEFNSVAIDAKPGKFEPEKIISSGSFLRLGRKVGNVDDEICNSPLAKHGTGLQRTFLWAAIKMLAETGRHKVGGSKFLSQDDKKVLLIEEPELFLHPSAVKSAMESLYAIAEHENWQIVTSTHSPNFIDLTQNHTTIIRIEKNDDTNHEVKTFSTDDADFGTDDKENLKMINFCNPYFNEFFFANKVILVEGETEYTIIKTVLEKNCFTSKEGIHIINCFGKGNIVTISKILNHFKVNYSVIHDSDNPKALRKSNYIKNGAWTNNYKINDELNAGREKGLKVLSFVSIPNFEGEYLNGVKGSSKPFEAWKYFTDNTNEHTKRFASMLHYINGDEDACDALYQGVEEIVERVEKYIDNHGLSEDPLWELEEVKPLVETH